MTIIVLLILAGVSINAIVGDNGVISQAESAKEKQREAEIREELEYYMYNYNASEYADIDDGLSAYFVKGLEDGSIDNFLASTDGDFAIIEKDGKYYQVTRTSNEKNEYIINYTEIDNNVKTIMEQEAELHKEGDSTSAIILTKKTVKQREEEGTGFQFINGQTYVILEQLDGKDFDFIIPAGDPITIKIAYDMNIDNSEKPDKSAIDIAEGGTLNLYVYGTVNVNSGYGVAGEVGNANGARGGSGGHAGIHVPKTSEGTATLNLYGDGTIRAFGGNAGNGTESSAIYGGGRRRSELELVLVEMVEKEEMVVQLR